MNIKILLQLKKAENSVRERERERLHVELFEVKDSGCWIVKG